MIEEWRILLYPLGFLSSLIFGARFIIQWVGSERQGKSLVTRSFWQLSLLGNLFLALHAFIQVQYHVCLVQACNGVISWRNLNLMQEHPPIPFQRVIWLLFATIILTSCAFFLQDIFLVQEGGNWFRTPKMAWHTTNEREISLFWHFWGFTGYLLFSSRFWIQWWSAEKLQKSCLLPSFWWISLSGALISSIYFFLIQDPINLIGPLIGLIPYIRNLILMHKFKQTS